MTIVNSSLHLEAMLSHQDIIKMNKKILISFAMILLLGILIINFTSAVYCCERLKSSPEAWCQEVEQKEDCATGINPFSKTNELYKQTPIVCESTSYCKEGTCIDQQEGTCKASTQVVCSIDEGIWKKEKKSDLGECQLGCCLLNNEISFVTLTRCKKLSSDAGIETNYRSDIQSESECILSVTSDEKGACVYEEEYQRTCRMTTQSECKSLSESEFHLGYLCSAQQLTTNCGPSKETTCLNEDVYFIDTCGNPANIYDCSPICFTCASRKIITSSACF